LTPLDFECFGVFVFIYFMLIWNCSWNWKNNVSNIYWKCSQTNAGYCYVFFYMKFKIYQNMSWGMDCMFLSSWVIFGIITWNASSTSPLTCPSHIYNKFSINITFVLLDILKNATRLWLLFIGMVYLTMNCIAYPRGFFGVFITKLGFHVHV